MIPLRCKLVSGLACALFVGLCAALLPYYPGSPIVGSLFLGTGVLFVGICYARPASFFLLSISGFLATGFLAKAVAHFTFGVALIEPIGQFSGQWDDALLYASSGFIGASAAAMLAMAASSFDRVSRGYFDRWGVILIAVGLVITLLAATAIYFANLQFNILRIGFPLGIAIDPRLYAVLSFAITWGALLASFCFGLWLLDSKGWSPWPMVCLAALVGTMASLTMGSRVQLLLYLLAATWLVIARWDDSKRRWRLLAASYILAVALAIASYFLVSMERRYDFVVQPKPVETAASLPMEGASVRSTSDHPGSPTASTVPGNKGESLQAKIEAASESYSSGEFQAELRNLAVMRWVGLEGPMVMAGAPDQAGLDLLREAVLEDPAEGKNGIYQRLSGDFYGSVEHYTFLTLPGPVGVASFSGSYLVVGVFLFGVIIVGHLVEWVVATCTRNLAASSVAGVSLAYITVQMGFPWTWFVYVLELILAAAALGSARLIISGVGTGRGARRRKSN